MTADPIDEAWADVLAAASAASRAVETCDLIDDTITAAQIIPLLAACRDAKRAFDFAYKEIEKQIVARAGEKKFEVAGIGVVEVKGSKRRTRWDIGQVVHHAISRAVDSETFLGEWDDDELAGGGFTPKPPSQIAHDAADVVLSVVSASSGKVGGMRLYGLDPADFCTEDPTHYGVVLPGGENEVKP